MLVVGGLKTGGLLSGSSPSFGSVSSTGNIIIAPTGQEVAIAIDAVDNFRAIAFDQSTLASASAPYIAYNAGTAVMTISPGSAGLVVSAAGATNSMSISQNSGSNALTVTTAGARLKLSSAGTTDYLTSDGLTKITAAGSLEVTDRLIAVGDPTSPANSAFRIAPQDAEPTGANAVGDIYVTTAGVLKICTVAGTPGTWVSVGSQ